LRQSSQDFFWGSGAANDAIDLLRDGMTLENFPMSRRAQKILLCVPQPSPRGVLIPQGTHATRPGWVA
jgi:hypothetical protein